MVEKKAEKEAKKVNDIIHMKNLFEMKRKDKIEEKFRQYIQVCLKAENQNVKDLA